MAALGLFTAAALVGGAVVTRERAGADPLVFTYEVRGLDNVSDLEQFAAQAAETYADGRGWNLGGSVSFVRVPVGGSFTLWLAAAGRLPGFGSPCSSMWSCRQGRNVIINETRWLTASPAWNASGGSLRDYRHMVVNHETGHWLGFGHSNCGGTGQPAPVMQQQSISLQGCAFNAWPLDWERGQLSARLGVPIQVGAPIGALNQVSGGLGEIRVVGWALDPDDWVPIDVHVLVDGVWAGASSAQITRPDVGAAFPRYGPNHGYDVRVPASGGIHLVCVHGINIGPGGLNPPVGCAVVGVTPLEPVGSVDRGSDAVGAVRVAGWTFDTESPEPIDVHVYVDGVFRAAARADRPRADVAAAHPAYGAQHGYDVTVPATSGVHGVCVYGINVGRGRGNPIIGCRIVDVARVEPVGAVDAVADVAASVRVRGWAFDPETASPVDVHVYVDGAMAGAAKADRARPDVAAAYPSYGAAHGYDLTVPAGSGRHTVCVFAVNLGRGTANPLLGCRVVDLVGVVPVGALDGVEPSGPGVRARGWALDPETPNPVKVHLYVDGVFRRAVVADGSRPDVGAAHPGYGASHGFDVVLTTAPGAHTVCAYAINVGAGTGNPLLGCRQATAATTLTTLTTAT